MQTKIKFRLQDRINLKKAVRNFNNKIDRIITEENKNIIPKKIRYIDLKRSIVTREEFNSLIKSLNRFLRKNSEDIISLRSGEKLTKWEKKEIEIQKRIITRRYNKEMENVSKTGYMNEKQRKYQRQMESFQNLENLTGKELRKKINIISKISNASYNYKKAVTYRENFLKSLKELKKDNKAFKDIYKLFKDIKNPLEFFEKTQLSRALQDFFEWYWNPTGYGNFQTVEDLVYYIKSEYNFEV